MTLRSQKRRYVDPVCGMSVSPLETNTYSTFRGSRLYFCKADCKRAFDADPQKYMPNGPRGFWRRYLDRLNKATGGKPPSCCG